MRLSRGILVVIVALLAGVLSLATVGSALAWGPGGPTGGPFGAMMGGIGPGGMMGGYRGGENGLYGPGAASGPGCPFGGYGPWSQNQPQGQVIGMDQAVASAESYIKSYGNQDLVLDEVMEFQYNYYALAKEKGTGRGAFELLIDKHSGRAYPEMGPNMMWNTKYGMMFGRGPGFVGSMMGGWLSPGQNASDVPMTVSAEQAKAAAQEWLDTNQPGSTTETPDQFYGYYTLHVLKGGKVTGMLSINGYNGQIWYHTWHGDFIQQKEMGSES